MRRGLFYGFILSLLNRNRPVRATNLRRRYVVFPIRAFRYGVPLLYRSVKFNARKPGAIKEGIRVDARHTVGYCYARKSFATIEGSRTDARHAAPDCYACKAGALIEGKRADARHAVGDCNSRKPSAITEGTFT